MTHQHHGIDYVELNAPDQEASRGFYAAAFGWGFNDYGPEYSGFQGPSGDAAPADAPENGGLSTQGPATPLVILYSEDIDSTLAAVREAGGTILQEPYDFPGGRRFHFADPAGNELAVWGK
jgi:predicted enzyme related to lactoylglutathione lyase